MAFAPARLFSAVVVTGAALAGCPRERVEMSGSAPISPDPIPDASVPADATDARESCPDGSELPFPPCWHIL